MSADTAALEELYDRCVRSRTVRVAVETAQQTLEEQERLSLSGIAMQCRTEEESDGRTTTHLAELRVLHDRCELLLAMRKYELEPAKKSLEEALQAGQAALDEARARHRARLRAAHKEVVAQPLALGHYLSLAMTLGR